MFTKLFALSNSKHNVKKYSKCLYVCVYAYKLVLVYLGVSSKVKVCLFGQNAESNFSIGDVLQVSAVYSKTYQNNMQLPSSPSTKCEVRNKIKICGGPIFVGIHDPQIYILTNVFLYNQTCFPLFKDISMKLRLHNQVKN